MSEVEVDLPKGIHDLPDELLLKVFDSMDHETLMKSTQICKKWNEIIGQNTTIMKKIQLVIKGDREREMLPVALTRKYHTIKLMNWNNEWNDLLNGFLKATDLRVLVFIKCNITKAEDILEFRKFMLSANKLESLRIEESIDRKHIILLKPLMLTSGFSGTRQLKSLELKDVILVDFLIDFLACQKSLETLVLKNFHLIHKNSNLEKLKEIQFPLKKLAINNYGWKLVFGSEENLLLFMSKFADSLEELEVENTLPESFYELVFEKFHKLKTLKLLIDKPRYATVCNNLTPNPSVRKLIVDGYRNLIKPIQGFICNLPNIETLVLHESKVTEKLMMFISSNLTKLENLLIPNIPKNTFVEIRIPSLKSLTIMAFHFDDWNTKQHRYWARYWRTITLATPNLETFRIFHVGDSIESDYLEIFDRDWPHLKHIAYGKGLQYGCSDWFLEDHVNKFRNLTTLKLPVNAFEYTGNSRSQLSERVGFRLIVRPLESLKIEDFLFGLWNEKNLLSLKPVKYCVKYLGTCIGADSEEDSGDYSEDDLGDDAEDDSGDDAEDD